MTNDIHVLMWNTNDVYARSARANALIEYDEVIRCVSGHQFLLYVCIRY